MLLVLKSFLFLYIKQFLIIQQSSNNIFLTNSGDKNIFSSVEAAPNIILR